MIELSEEAAVPVGELPKHIPTARGGRRVNVSTVIRWCLKGVRGVRLESVVVGGRRYTDRAAIARFIAATTAARQPPPDPVAVRQLPLPLIHDRGAAIAVAQEGLARAGV